MAYQKEIFDRVEAMYEQDRQTSLYLRNQRITQLYATCSELKDIDRDITVVAVEISQKILASPDDGAALALQLTSKVEKLNGRRAALLSSIGLPADYTDITYTCNTCKDTGYTLGKRCECMERRLTRVAYSASDLAALLSTQSFDTFKLSMYSDIPEGREGESPRERMRDILQTCRAFAEQFALSQDNLLFYGGVGLGKTFLSSCIAREVMAAGYSVVYQSAATLFSMYSDYKFGRIPPDEAKPKLSALMDCDLLIIDDLGTEAISSPTVSYLFELLNGRMLTRKKMIISTNLTINELAKMYSERFHSRMFEHFTLLKFIGEDIRLKNMREQ